jgi:hypothetical protein
LQDNNPQELMMSLMSGDHSAFGDLFQNMDQKYGDKLKDENIDESEILAKAGTLFQNAPGGQNLGGAQQGMNPMAMMNMFNNMMPPQPVAPQAQQQIALPQVHDVQTSPYFSQQQEQQAPQVQKPAQNTKKTQAQRRKGKSNKKKK